MLILATGLRENDIESVLTPLDFASLDIAHTFWDHDEHSCAIRCVRISEWSSQHHTKSGTWFWSKSKGISHQRGRK
jgi:hypothetical protein